MVCVLLLRIHISHAAVCSLVSGGGLQVTADKAREMKLKLLKNNNSKTNRVRVAAPAVCCRSALQAGCSRVPWVLTWDWLLCFYPHSTCVHMRVLLQSKLAVDLGNV